MKKLLLMVPILFFMFFLSFTLSRAQSGLCSPSNFENLSLGDATQCKDDLEKALDLSINATKPHESQIRNYQSQLNGIKKRVSVIENELADKRRKIEKGYEELIKQKDILDKTIVDYYIKSYQNNFLSDLLSNPSAIKWAQIAGQKKVLIERDKQKIVAFALLLHDLEEQSKRLENEQTQLAALKKSLDEQTAKLDKLVSGAKAYQGTLSSQIAQLSARQQQILGRRLTDLGIPRSAATSVPACVDDRDKDPGFAPRIAFFTYGVPNRTGLNQYGARGRAESQHPAQQILQAYFNADYTTGYSTSINIHVVGTNEQGQSFDDNWSIEDYLKHLYEMPSTWHPEALKAQAIAARSYALAYTNNGASSICPSQKCQVVKREENSGAWKQAVTDTAGIVLTSGGQPIKAWYSSTHGGYAFPTSELPGWSATAWTKHAVDTTTGGASGFGDLGANAYDRDSPWFYCDWGGRGQNKTAWLRQEEVADIVNVILLARADSGTKEKLYQTDKPHPFGGEVWSADKVKDELKTKNITPFENVTNVVADGVDFGSGRTTNVTVSGNITQSFSGSEFKDWFNLRAPANIQIVGPLYNIERR